MFQVGSQWNPLQAQLRELIAKKESFKEAMQLALTLHGILHCSTVSGTPEKTVMDSVWENLSEDAFYTMPTIKDVTVAWNIWHVTRIEDLTANILIANGTQILNDAWRKKLNTSVTDTGNAMTDEEIIALSRELDREALKAYRNAVGLRTREILQALKPEDLGRKFSKKQVNRIFQEGGVTTHPDSRWLLDFWGKKNVTGILLMPITRHQMGHLNDCFKLKNACARSAKKQAGYSLASRPL